MTRTNAACRDSGSGCNVSEAHSCLMVERVQWARGSGSGWSYVFDQRTGAWEWNTRHCLGQENRNGKQVAVKEQVINISEGIDRVRSKLNRFV